MSDLVRAIAVLGAMATLLSLFFFFLLRWGERESERVWTSGTEAERMEDRIDEVVAVWRVVEVEHDLRTTLTSDLRSFCTDGLEDGATADDIFGADIDEFAMSWLRAHRHDPQLRIVALLTAISTCSGYVAMHGFVDLMRSVFGWTTADNALLDLTIGAGFGLFLALLTTFRSNAGRRFWERAFQRLGLGTAAAFSFAVVALLALSLGVVRFVRGPISEAAITEEFVPNLWVALITTGTSFAIAVTAGLRLSNENNKTIEPLFED